MNLLVGMNVHRWGRSFVAYDRSRLCENLDTCKELGIKLIRYNNSFRGEEAAEDVALVANEIKKRDMQMMLVVDDAGWSKEKISGKQENLEAYYEEYMFRIAASQKGKIGIYQVFNEMDIAGMRGDIGNIILPGKDGKEKGEYDCVLWERAIASVKGALKGIKKGDPDAKTCVNFAWWHTALIYEMAERGCKFDMVGIDWYSDCEEVSSIDLLIADVKKHIPDSDIVICETNFWMHPMGRDPIEKQEALKVKEKRFAGQEKWVPEFIQKLVDLKEPKLKAVCFYELLDEPIYEKDRGSYHGESHFGFIECDEHGDHQVKKPAFYSLQKKIKELK